MLNARTTVVRTMTTIYDSQPKIHVAGKYDNEKWAKTFIEKDEARRKK